jgi:hypothetical protein
MGEYHLNLSTKPFPAYRIVNVMLLTIFVALAGVSASQAYGFLYYKEKANGIRGQARDLEADVMRLVAEQETVTAKLGGASANIGQINYINGLIDRRNFCWICLLHHIEIRIPPNVHLTSLKPDVNTDGTILLNLNAQGKSLADLAHFVDQMQQSEVFEKVDVNIEEKKPMEFGMVMQMPYFPSRDKSLAGRGGVATPTQTAPRSTRGE